MKLQQFDLVNLKLKMVKTINTHQTINAILINIEINIPKLANTCKYKLATTCQNLMEIHLVYEKILQKVLGG